MSRHALPWLLVAVAFTCGGCESARYSTLRVQVVDERTLEGIPDKGVRTWYMKPALDFTRQRRDQRRTDHDGFATITLATNHSQWTLFGSTHGIIPQIGVHAVGYNSRAVGVPDEAFHGADPWVIRLEKRDELPYGLTQDVAAWADEPSSATDTNAHPKLVRYGFVYIQPSPEQHKHLDAARPGLKLQRKLEQACTTIEDAGALLWRSINIATGGRRACTEYQGFFWFSRLDWAGQDDRTFKSGFAVKKGTGEIYRWEDKKAEP